MPIQSSWRFGQRSIEARTPSRVCPKTVTLDFADPLPAGSYAINLSAGIQTEPFNEQEAELLSPAPGFNGHPVVSLNPADSQITEGSRVEGIDLVLASGDLGSFNAFGQGTPFQSQLHADMGALLDAILTERGDDPAITSVLSDQMLASLDPALGQFGQRPTSLLGIWLDPASMDLEDPNGDHITYDLKDDTLIVDRDDCFVLVIWNIEIIICPVFGGEFSLKVDDVPETARGGVVKLRQDGNETTSLTDDLRAGVDTFTIRI